MNRTPPVPTWIPVRTIQKVVIPTPDGKGVAYTINHEVDAWFDPETKENYLDGHAIDELDRLKSRYLGILTPEQILNLRNAIGATQSEMAALLQLGEKTWTRWETGKERPSRSINVLLLALCDGRLDVNYLRTLADPASRNQFDQWKPNIAIESKSEYADADRCWPWRNDNEPETLAA